MPMPCLSPQNKVGFETFDHIHVFFSKHLSNHWCTQKTKKGVKMPEKGKWDSSGKERENLVE